MPFLTVDKENFGDIDLYYEDHGAGKPVVLIHGWPLSGRSWEKQVPALLAAGSRVITYDRRGFGQSSQPAFGYNYDTLASDLHKLLTKLELRDATIVGFSMGGGEVARYFGKYGAERVAKAAFIAAIPPFLLKTADNPSGENASGFEEIKQALAADRPAFLAGFFKKFYNVGVLGAMPISDQAVQASWNVAIGASPKGTIDCVSAWLEDFRNDLAATRVPTLVVHGDADQILPIGITGKLTHELVKGSRYVVIPGAPHGLNWTHAEQLNRELLDFLAS
jgi:pimeloyl-ACP methyl ester carboxylesterase